MKYFIFLLFIEYEHSGSHAKLTTYFSQDPLCSYLDEQQKNDIYFLNNCRDVNIVPTFARQKIWQTSKFCHSRRYIRKYVSQAILCQDIRSGTNEKVAGPAKVLPGLSGRSCS